MEEKLSSTSAVKIEHSAGKETQYDLPQSYGKTESYLLPKDPAWMFLFWDIVKSTYDDIMAKHGGDIFAVAHSVIRIYDITDITNFDGTNAHKHLDVPVYLDAGSWYIHIPQSGRHYICDLGLIKHDGSFILLSRSNAIKTPTGRISEFIDEKWMLVEGDYQKLLEMTGTNNVWGGAEGGASERMQRILSQRWKMYGLEGVPSSHVSSWMSSHTMPSSMTDEDIWLKADCEIIIYGQASKNARITLDGKPIIPNPENTFYIRRPLKAGDVINLPVRAEHHEKREKNRAITIKAQREEA